MKRTLFFEKAYHLGIQNNQLKTKNKKTGELRVVALEDVGFMVFEHPEITFTLRLFQLMAAYNIAVVFCDEKRLPCSMLVHNKTHYLQNHRLRLQFNAAVPLKKRLWQKTIRAKISNQADLPAITDASSSLLRRLIKSVEPGDPANVEAVAACKYWSAFLGGEFVRERYGPWPNPALNYAYAVLRAATARALAGRGLNCTFGIHHHNSFNAFCLADDIMEPYRPFADEMVMEMIKEFPEDTELTTSNKMFLLGLLRRDVFFENKVSPLMVALSHTAASLVRAFEQGSRALEYPKRAEND